MKKILIVEPDPAVGLYYLRSFTVAGFTVEHATNQPRSIEALSRFKPHLVFLNLQLPRNKALSLLKFMRSAPWMRSLPVVAFFEENKGELFDEACQLGVKECVIIEKKSAQELLKAASRFFAQLKPTEEKETQETKRLSSHGEKMLKSKSARPKTTKQSTEILTPKPRKTTHSNAAPPNDSETLERLLAYSRSLLKPQSQSVQADLILNLYQGAQDLTEFLLLRRKRSDVWMCVALVALLKELFEKPMNVSGSNRRTINQAIVFLDTLMRKPIPDSEEWEPSFKVLAVDDDIIARKVVINTLKLVDVVPDSEEDPVQALERGRLQKYDLFILDLNMPGMDGFQLCRSLREIPMHTNTPVIFVTAEDRFETRIRASTSGGNDYIGKPFVATELAVKTLIHLLSEKS